MTVRELIQLLQSLPPDVQDFPVIYACCSDWATMEPDQIDVQRSTDKLTYGTAVEHHNRPGQFRNYTEYEWERKGIPTPKPANVVTFPGN